MIHPARLPAGRTLVMGILNITPDSFSGDGLAVGGDVTRGALEKARQFIADGADILDVGENPPGRVHRPSPRRKRSSGWCR